MNLNDFELNLVERNELGTSAARKLRAQNQAIVSVYGPEFAPKSASVDMDILKKAMAGKTLFNKFTTLNIGKEKVIAFAKVAQLHPVTDKVLHVDFQAVKKGQEIEMKVPVRFLNKELCEAIKLGGLLNIVCPYIELKAKAEDMPAYLDCDLTNAVVGVSIRVTSLPIGKNVTLLKKYESKVVATVLAARKKGGAAADEGADAAETAAS